MEVSGTMRIVDADEVEAGARSGRATLIQRTPTGFPSSVGHTAEPPCDLHTLLIWRPRTTLFVEMADNALLDSGIFVGDVLVVDRALRPAYGAVVVVALDGALLARHYCPDSDAIHLLPAHPDVAPISIRLRDHNRYQIWGVVTATMHRLRILAAYP
jgi:DNA polymerase V